MAKKISESEKAMYLMLMGWSSGIGESHPDDPDYTKHYNVGETYWSRDDYHGWHLSTDKAFEREMKGTGNGETD